MENKENKGKDKEVKASIPVEETPRKEVMKEEKVIEPIKKEVVEPIATAKVVDLKKEITPNAVNEIPNNVSIRQFRRTGWLPPGHDGEFRFSNTSEILTVQRDRHTGQLNTGLTTTEEASLEAELRLEKGTLSKHNIEYWGAFEIEIPSGGATFNLKDNPTDFIRWKVCLVHQEVANSEVDRDSSPFASYVLTSKEDQSAETNKLIDTKMTAYKMFAGLSETDMKDFLLVYGKHPGKDAKLEFIKAEVGRVIEEDPNKFIDILNATDYKLRLFVNKCISAEVLKNTGTKYILHGGDVIGYSLTQALDYLGDPSNQEVYVTLKTQLEEK